MQTVPSKVVLECFYCGNREERPLDKLPFEKLTDYHCPKCHLQRTTHVSRVITETKPRSALRRILGRFQSPRGETG